MTGQPAGEEPVIGGLAEVWASVADACGGLSGEEWMLPTDCPGWTVRDQLSHLIGVERMLLGDPAPPPVTEVPPHVKNSFGELNESWIEARRSTPGPEVLSEFVDTVGRRLEALRSMPVTAFDEVGWSPVGEVPYRDFMETRVMDCWSHEQDIRRAVGRPGGRNGAGEAVVLDRCVQTMAYVVGKRVAPPDGTLVLFEVTGPLGRRVSVTVEGGRAQVSPEASEVIAVPEASEVIAVPEASEVIASPTVTPLPTVTLTMDQEVFWRVSFGRVAPLGVVESGLVTVDGDVGLGRRVLESMPFMT